jgi:DNA-binding NarL/FixJ family response regulator
MPKRPLSNPCDGDEESWRRLARLSEEERLVLLWLRLGFTIDDIAAHLGRSTREIADVVTRALHKDR